MRITGLIGLLLFSSVNVHALEVTGKVLYFDCSQVVAKPASPKLATGCVVIVSGQSSGTAADGTKWTNNSTQLVISSQKLAAKLQSTVTSGASVLMEIDTKMAILKDINLAAALANNVCTAPCAQVAAGNVIHSYNECVANCITSHIYNPSAGFNNVYVPGYVNNPYYPSNYYYQGGIIR